MDALNDVLKKLNDIEKKFPKVDIELEVKKGIVQHLKQEGYNDNQILNVLNEVLQAWKNKTVTVGCVKYHSKQL